MKLRVKDSPELPVTFTAISRNGLHAIPTPVGGLLELVRDKQARTVMLLSKHLLQFRVAFLLFMSVTFESLRYSGCQCAEHDVKWCAYTVGLVAALTCFAFVAVRNEWDSL